MARDSDPTSTYGSAAADGTGTYGTNPAETYAYSDLRETQFKSKTHDLGLGDKLRLHGRDYAVTDIISEGTGEAVIYKVQDERGKVFALKLYFEFGNPKEEPSGETLKRIKEITDPDILKLHDFGVGPDKYRGKYCFEISDFAEGGDLFSVEDLKVKYTPEHIERTIIPEIFNGIRRLHSYKIFHCDLKPWNIFYLDRDRTDIVIGDYGSAKTFDLQAEKDARKTSTVKGTETYLAPEQSRGLISDKNDYYSFGVILLHLLYPESIAEDTNPRRVSKEKFERIVERQYDSVPIIDYDPQRPRLNTLIEGLTLFNHTNRWGRAEVERWLKGEEVEVRYRSASADSTRPVKLGYATIRTSKDFVRVLETNPSGYEDLIEDPDTYATVKRWLDSYRDIPARKAFDQMIRFYQPLGKEYVTEALLRFFEPERPVVIDMHSFDFFAATDVRAEVAGFVAKLDEVWKITPPERLRFHLFQLEFSLSRLKAGSGARDPASAAALLEKLRSVFGMPPESPDSFTAEVPTKIDPKNEAETSRQLLNLFYAFDPGRTFRDLNNRPVATLDELGLFFAREGAAFDNKFLAAERARFLEKLGKEKLARLGCVPFVFEIFKGKAEAKLELVELSFDEDGNYKVLYKYYKSLGKFLATHGVEREFTSRSEKNELHRAKRKLLESFGSVGDKFIAAVCELHNIKTLTAENLAEIRAKFRRESRRRYLYNYLANVLMSYPTGRLSVLSGRETQVQKRYHWEGALLVAFVSLLATLGLCLLFAVRMDWIPADQVSRYLILSAPVNLDGTEYAQGDFLKVTGEQEFAVCLQGGTAERCYPTQASAALLRQRGSSPLEQQGVDRFGSAAYEFSQPREVFKVTKVANIAGHQFPVGSVVDVVVDDGSRWCFKYGKKQDCFTRRSACRGDWNCADAIDGYGYVINSYQGRRLFTFSQAASVDSISYPRGSSWEISRESSWATCMATPGGAHNHCFLTEAAIKRFTQPNVPVATDFGFIGQRTLNVTRFDVGAAIVLALVVAGLAFWETARIVKHVKLFMLRGQMNTLRFKGL